MQYNFEDTRFDAQLNHLPWAQIINPTYDADGIKPYGLAIKLNNAQAVNFCPDDSYELTNHRFSNQVEEVLITKTPRISIVSKGQLYIKDRETGFKIGTLKDNYQLFLKDKLKYKTYNKCLIFLFNSQGKLLHDLPLQLTLSGATGVSFNKSYSNYENGLLSGGFIYELRKADFSVKLNHARCISDQSTHFLWDLKKAIAGGKPAYILAAENSLHKENKEKLINLMVQSIILNQLCQHWGIQHRWEPLKTFPKYDPQIEEIHYPWAKFKFNLAQDKLDRWLEYRKEFEEEEEPESETPFG